MANYKLNSKYIAGTLETMERELFRDDAFRLEWEDRRTAVVLAELAREMRREAGLSQTELAKKVGIPQPVIARLESRKPTRMPTLGTIARVAEACGRRMVVRFEKGIEGHEEQPLVAVE